MKTDEICAGYADQPVGLTLRMLREDKSDRQNFVLVEGGAAALRMLAELLIAVADEKENDGFSIGPLSAGAAHFSDEATLGIYIHRLD